MNRFRTLAVAAAIALSTGCSSNLATSPAPVPTGSSAPTPPASAIQHIVVMVQENRSLNNLFMSFPGADTSTTGLCKPYKPPQHKEICVGPSPTPVPLKPITLETCKCLGGTDIAHTRAPRAADGRFSDDWPMRPNASRAIIWTRCSPNWPAARRIRRARDAQAFGRTLACCRRPASTKPR